MGKHNVIIEDDTVSFNIYNFPLYFQCDAISHYVTPTYGHYGLGEAVRCGRDSMYLVTYPIGSNDVTKHMCDLCADELIKKARSLGYEIVDKRKNNSEPVI